MSPILSGIVVYVLAQLGIALYIARRRMRGENDYLLAGRRFGLAFATFTIFATWFGAETCIGAAGQVYAGGLSDSTADPFGYAACIFIMGAVFAVPLWRRKYTTFADLFHQRFSPGVERLAVLLLVPGSILWAAAQVRALGQIVSSSSEIDVELAIALAAAVVVIYTVYGGLLANASTDLVQGIVVIVGLAVVLFAVLDASGGLATATATVDPSRLHLFGGEDASPLAIIERWAVPIFGSVLAQELVVVILASHTPEIARRASFLAGSLYLVVGLIPVSIGLLGTSLIPGLEESEQILPAVAEKYLSTTLYVIFVGAIVSAILSTVSGALLAAGSLTAHNLVVPLKPQLHAADKVRIARIVVVVAGVVAFLLARHSGGVYELVEEASAFGSAGVFIAAVFGLFSRFGGPRAAYAALVVGTGLWVSGHYLFDLTAPYVLALTSALCVYVAVALFERRVELGDSVTAKLDGT